MKKIKTVAVIPAYNEQEHIYHVIKKTKKYVDSVVVVDDGSKDQTYENAKKAKPTLTLKHVINMGKGLAMKTGFEAGIKIGAKIIIFIDADGQHKPQDIPRLLEKMKKEELDIVIGVREFDTKMPPVLRFGNWFLLNTFNLLYNSNIHDFSNGLRAIKTKVYKKIKWTCSGYDVETEMLANAKKHNLNIGEIPIKTIYLNTVKGTTVPDGIKIFSRMLMWKLRG